jgi:hypothetical protein
MTRGVDDAVRRLGVCTGIAATWCPRCGDCKCPDGEPGVPTFNDPACPLHAPDSKHAERQ